MGWKVHAYSLENSIYIVKMCIYVKYPAGCILWIREAEYSSKNFLLVAYTTMWLVQDREWLGATSQNSFDIYVKGAPSQIR